MRKPIQYFFKVIGGFGDGNGEVKSILHCFCDDGTVWVKVQVPEFEEGSLAAKGYRPDWIQVYLPPIPQDDQFDINGNRI